MDGWRALLLYVGRVISCLHAYMYGNVWHSVVKRNTSDCVCVWVEPHSSAVRSSACDLEMRSCVRVCGRMCYRADETAYIIFYMLQCVPLNLFHFKMVACSIFKHHCEIVMCHYNYCKPMRVSHHLHYYP